MIRHIQGLEDHFEKMAEQSSEVRTMYKKVLFAIFCGFNLMMLFGFITSYGTVPSVTHTHHYLTCVTMMFISLYLLPLIAKTMTLDKLKMSFKLEESHK